MKDLDFNEQLLHLGECSVNVEFKNVVQVLSVKRRVRINDEMLLLKFIFSGLSIYY